jgi:hypothetical protein
MNKLVVVDSDQMIDWCVVDESMVGILQLEAPSYILEGRCVWTKLRSHVFAVVGQ